ncbi:hypothetical protein [Dyadobacter sp. NIV53]|uniref:hypothetical protein n=1 Tax=Dyadobacter sp. NIV53 TaxID=2861765 RepID=UPI001C86F58E|nr:hypothetical protein [Dyadobacter sp. NIV53]
MIFYRYKYTIYASTFLLFIGFVIWLIIKPSTFEIASKKLNKVESYGEIKWVWQQFQNDLGSNENWNDLVDKKLLQISLNDDQKRDLEKWHSKRKEKISPAEKATSNNRNDKEEEPANPMGEIIAVKGTGGNQSDKDLARLYNRLGDEKCEAFKAANAPHLYHIANEYYQYAATLTNTNPKVCE